MTDPSLDARTFYKTWTVLTGADSVLSEIVYRYGSRLPDEVRADALASHQECRRMAAEVRQRADELDPALAPLSQGGVD